MNSGDTALLIMFALACGALYFPHLFLRDRVYDTFWAPDGKADPWPIFRRAWRAYTLYFLWLAAILLFLFWIPEIMIGLLAFALLILGPVGILCFFADIYQHFFSARSQRPYWRAHPPPKLQFRMMDAYAALFVYGITMAVFAAPAKHAELDVAAVAGSAVFLLLSESFGFFVALDVLRRTKRLQRPLHRALFVAGLAAYSCLLLPFTFLSWRAWRYCLWKRNNPPPGRTDLLPEDAKAQP